MPPATARPFLKLVTQTLPDPAAGHGDLEDRLYDLERFALDFDRYAATPGLRTLAASLLDLTRGLVDASVGHLPFRWAEAMERAKGNGSIDTPEELKTRLDLTDAACETLEAAGLEDFADVEEDAREAWAKATKDAVDTLKEIREYAGAELDDEDLVRWVTDQTAYEERAEQWGGMATLLNAAEDGVVAKAVGDDAKAPPQAEETPPEDPRVAQMLAEAEEARKSAAAATIARDEALAEVAELRSVVANIRKALGDLAESLPGAPAAAAPAEVPPPPPAPSMLAAIGEDGIVVDLPQARIAIAGSKYFALFDYRIHALAPRIVCALGDPDVGNVALAAERIHEYVYASPVAHGTLDKLPKVADAPEDCVAVGLPGQAYAYFSLRLLRTVLQGAKNARFSVVHTDREGNFALVVMHGGYRGGLLQSREAPMDVTAVPVVGEALGEEQMPPAGLLPPRVGGEA